MSLYFLLTTLHIVSTVLGVGGATAIEIHLNKALRDGKMDTVERDFLGSDFFITRVGMVLGLITGIGFVVMYYIHNQLFRLESGIFWAKLFIFVIIIINAYLLHKHKIGLYWGSAFSFVSWWTVMLLGLFLSNSITIFPGETLSSFFAVLFVYSTAVILGAFILHKLRERLKNNA